MREMLLGAICIGLFAAAWLTAAADAKAPKLRVYPTTATLAWTPNPSGPDTFSGVVSSRNPGCFGRRQVAIVSPGGQRPVQPTLAVAFTAADGTFSVMVEPQTGTQYYARVVKKVFNRKRVRTVCSSTNSPGYILVP